MGNRVVYGHTNSSNGWPMVDQAGCTWVEIPGTNPPVHIQIQTGQPQAILRAFVADINAYVEHVRDADTACWTGTNSVDTSNHLSATAVDVDWELHPFRVANAGFNSGQIATIREMLDFYEGTVFWGNDWSNPKDAMHFQLASRANGGNIDTYGNPHTGDFIARKIRADGFSTFRRANNPAPPPRPTPAPAQLTRAEGYALRILNEGRRRGVTPKGIQIAFATGIVESNITVYANQKLPKSLALPHDAVGNDGYSVGIFQQQVRDTGNGWWWGDEKTCMGVESSAGLFYDRLVRLPYNGTSKTPGGFAQQIQGSAYPLRYDQHWDEAVALYNKLAGISSPTDGDDDLSAEDSRLLAAIAAKVDKLTAGMDADGKFPSRSFFAKDQVWGETPLGYEGNMDGNINELYMSLGYLLDVPSIVADVEYIAANGVAPASWAGSLGDGWLAEVGQQWCQNLVDFRKALFTLLKGGGVNNIAAPATVIYRDAPAAPAGDTADHIAANYRATSALLASEVDKQAADQLSAVLKIKTEGTEQP